jgi:hypothetical protein
LSGSPLVGGRIAVVVIVLMGRSNVAGDEGAALYNDA